MSTTEQARTDVRLVNLRLHNFKGVKDYEFEPDGKDTSIFGDNATGKTTIADACWWLLGGKDSEGRSDFIVKRLTEDGEAERGLDHEVEATFMIGDEKKTLRKVYKEKWVKRRGQTEREFDGHTTDYFVNGVPTTAGEFAAIVAESMVATLPSNADEIMRILTDPYYFSAGIHWKERRQLLLDVCGDVSDEDVVASNDDLADLPGILEERSLDDQRKVVMARRKQINDELDKLPIRIDEADRALPDVSELSSPEDCQTDIEKATAAKSEAEQEKARIEVGGQVAEKTKELREIEASIQDAKNTAREEEASKKEGMVTERDGVSDQLSIARTDLRDAESDINRANSDIDDLDKKMTTKRDEWKAINDEVFEYSEPDTCAACGQKLPVDAVDAAHQKALEAFNTSKASRLEEVTEVGKKAKSECDELKSGSDARTAKLDDAQKRVETLSTKHGELSESITAVKVEPDTDDLEAKKTTLEEAIAKLKTDNTAEIKVVDERIGDEERRISIIQGYIKDHELRERGQERIEELKGQEKTLAGEFEDLERQLHLMDLFVRTKVDLLTDRINDRFRLARFKLFNLLVNGGIEECCEVSYQGVPWGNLNHGAQINIGLDVIRTLHDHFNVALPIFIDRAESVTSLLMVDCQTIRFIVSADDKQLRMEIA